MGDMPCVWCLLYIQGLPYGHPTCHAYKPGAAEAERPVASWAEAEDTEYGSGLIIRDHNGDRCGLTAKTLVSGDAVCFGHAVGALRARLR